jgi:triosephosphate isomerase
MRQLIAGNWKMNGLGASLAEIESLRKALAEEAAQADVLICPPATLIARAVAVAGKDIAIGGQDCHAEPSGAYTGDVSAEMLKDAGASTVIVGHSERRQYHGETDAVVAAKAYAAWRAGLKSIICIGETEAQRENGHALSVCTSQMQMCIPEGASVRTTAIAYEPIWAIGTGKTPTSAQIVEVHTLIRNHLTARFGEGGREIRILYGGSVKPGNAAEILALTDVNGALVGGASLKAADFLPIIRASAGAA